MSHFHAPTAKPLVVLSNELSMPPHSLLSLPITPLLLRARFSLQIVHGHFIFCGVMVGVFSSLIIYKVMTIKVSLLTNHSQRMPPNRFPFKKCQGEKSRQQKRQCRRVFLWHYSSCCLPEKGQNRAPGTYIKTDYFQ